MDSFATLYYWTVWMLSTNSFLLECIRISCLEYITIYYMMWSKELWYVAFGTGATKCIDIIVCPTISLRDILHQWYYFGIDDKNYNNIQITIVLILTQCTWIHIYMVCFYFWRQDGPQKTRCLFEIYLTINTCFYRHVTVNYWCVVLCNARATIWID